ncbi:MAG: 50S ribosomal protein L28 [Negativicutes bacterium]|nr:50S ribosomal protein L28 [Negativicutes bacterium]
MASLCDVCGKGPLSGNNVSHSNRKTRRSWKPNIQRAKASINGQIRRVNVCTRCLRSGRLTRAV